MRFLVLLDHFSTLGISALPGGTLAVILMTRACSGSLAFKGGILAQLTADCAAVGARLSGDPSLVYADTPLRVKLVSLSPGQLPVSHALLHFGW